MTKFIAVSNSTIFDVCMNTYGSLNYLAKLIFDNNHGGINTYPYNGQEFLFDEKLVKVNTNKSITGIGNESIKYATRK